MDHRSLVEGIHPSSYPGAMSGTRLPKPLSASLVEILPLVKKRANSAAGKVCLSNSEEKFASSANTDGNRKGKGWSSLSTRRGVFGVCLSAKCCCCASSLALEYRAACKNFCRFAACERWDCGDLSIYKQGEIALVSKTSF